MKKLRFVLGILAVTLVLGVFFSGCASLTSPVMLQFSTVNDSVEKTGTATSKLWFGIFGGDVNFPTIETAAKNGGITRITAVQYYVRPGILGLWTDFYTIVNGE
ncbi:MAG: TRL-like family protein [Treponema sp.]|nr:TRL-like family protein [Treponema sp.]